MVGIVAAADLDATQIRRPFFTWMAGGTMRGWRISVGVPTAAYVFMTKLCAVPASRETEMMRLSMKTTLDTAVLVDDGGTSDVVSFSRHRCCRSRQLDRDVPEETLDLGLTVRTMTAPSVSFSLLGASFGSKCWLEGTREGAVLHLPQGQRRIPAGTAEIWRRAVVDGYVQDDGVV